MTERIALTLAQTAEAIAIPERTLRDQVAKGLFPVPCRQVGRRRLFSAREIERWLARSDEEQVIAPSPSALSLGTGGPSSS